MRWQWLGSSSRCATCGCIDDWWTSTSVAATWRRVPHRLDRRRRTGSTVTTTQKSRTIGCGRVGVADHRDPATRPPHGLRCRRGRRTSPRRCPDSRPRSRPGPEPGQAGVRYRGPDAVGVVAAAAPSSRRRHGHHHDRVRVRDAPPAPATGAVRPVILVGTAERSAGVVAIAPDLNKTGGVRRPAGLTVRPTNRVAGAPWPARRHRHQRRRGRAER